MKIKQLGLVSGAAALTMVLLSHLVGCETESATHRIKIEPPYARLHRNQSMTFTASGGYEYLWTISDRTLGMLNTREGETVVYTSIASSSASGMVQTVTVTGFIEGQGGGTTASNQTSYSASAEAYVTHY